MYCIESTRRWAWRRLASLAGGSVLLLLSACGVLPGKSADVARQAGPGPLSPAARPEPPSAATLALGAVALPAPKAVRTMHELHLQAAQRLVAANPGRVYLGQVPDVLLAIPVLEVELREDGQIKRITVLRKPKQALDTVELAIAAVRRAAPFGNVSRMPAPWKFTETFLFDDERRFKPRTLDQ